jgi:hypothetical protein
MILLRADPGGAQDPARFDGFDHREKVLDRELSVGVKQEHPVAGRVLNGSPECGASPLVAGRVDRLKFGRLGSEPIEDGARVVATSVVADDDLELLKLGNTAQILDPTTCSMPSASL